MLTTFHRTAITLALALSMTACMTLEQKMTKGGAVRLSGDQVKVHLQNNTEGWSKGAGYYAPDGSMQVIWKGASLAGKYSIDDKGNVCVNVDSWKEFCNFYMQENDAIMMISDKRNEGARQMYPGNYLSQL